MNKKFLMALLALPLCFASCNQEELVPQTNDAKLDGLKVIENPTFVVNQNGESLSRATANGWEKTDEVGLALTASGGILKAETNKNYVYANARLFLEDEGEGRAWKTTSVVYEGTHFAYYPFDGEHKSVKQMTRTLATSQKAGEEGYKEMWDKGRFAFSLPRVLDNETAGYNKTNEFELFTLSNRLNMGLYVSNRGDLEDDVDVKVKSVTLKASGLTGEANNIFAQEVQLNTSNMAKTYANVDDETTAVELFDENLNASKSAVTYPTRLSQIKTTVVSTEDESMVLGEDAAYPEMVTLFTFPTKPVASTEPLKISIIVETNFGNVTIDAKANKTLIDGFISYFNGTNENYDFTKRGEYNINKLIPVDMTTVALPTSFNISSQEDWDDAVKAISMLGKSTQAYTFKLTPTNTEKTVYLSSISLPNAEKFKSLKVSGTSASLSIASDVVLDPANAITFDTNLKIQSNLTFKSNMLGAALDYSVKSITIDENASMYVGKGVVVTSDNVVNNGTLENDGTIQTATTLTDKAYIVNNGAFNNNGTLSNKGASAEFALVENNGVFSTYYYAEYKNVKINNNEQVILVEGNFQNFKDAHINSGSTGTIEIADPVSTAAELAYQASLGCTRVTLEEGVNLSIANNTYNSIVFALTEGSTLTGSNAEVKSIVTTGNATLAGKITATDVTLAAESTLSVAENAVITINTLDYSNATVDNSGQVIATTIINTNGAWSGDSVE